ncbi:hypothetical protein KKH43_03300 [Patescibacteria group bacterium]|nr:hypothetical protein [Patescibacteria group bacterium]
MKKGVISKIVYVFLGAIVVLALASVALNSAGQKEEVQMSVSENTIGSDTKEDILNVLWLSKDDALPEAVQKKMTEKQNTPEGMGEDMATMIEEVGANHVPLVLKYPKRYDQLKSTAEKGMSPKQSYNLPGFMGQDYFKGYADMDSIKELTFPKDHSAHEDFQFGWYFFSGNYMDANNNPVDVVVIFFRRALYPPDIAKEMGLTEIENQAVETVVGVSLGDKNIHITGSEPVISGASGLVTLNANPLLAQVGNNKAESLKEDELFPMKLEVQDPEKDLKIDLTLEKGNPVLLQGDNGKAPSIFGLGSWYYSIPNIESKGTVSYGDDTRELTGKMWMDNQWMAGISPPGYPNTIFIQALSNVSNGYKGEAPKSWGWDWSDVQFDDNTEVTFASMHSTLTKDLKNKGENPPENVTRETSGKYVHEDGTYENIDGTITITKWMKSSKSEAWYPNGWDVEFPGKNITFTMTPTVDNQFLYSASGEIREGGVEAEGTKDGKNIHGFGFGEAVGYSGQDYYFQESFKLLGIEDTPENRDLFTAKPPGAWLVVQSIAVLTSPFALIILMIMIVVHMVRKRKSRA